MSSHDNVVLVLLLTCVPGAAPLTYHLQQQYTQKVFFLRTLYDLRNFM